VRPGDSRAVVVRVVVDDDDLERWRLLLVGERVEAPAERAGAVPHGHDDADRRCRHDVRS
jgi:hypothetical protein